MMARGSGLVSQAGCLLSALFMQCFPCASPCPGPGNGVALLNLGLPSVVAWHSRPSCRADLPLASSLVDGGGQVG